MGKNNKKKNQGLSASQSSSNIIQNIGNKINGHKMKMQKNKKRKSKKKIHQLFERLRNETVYEKSMSLETVPDDTVIELTNNDMTVNRMITPVKSKTRSTPSLIVINDDDDVMINPCRELVSPRSDMNSSPIHSSTPKQSNSHPKISLNNNSSAQNLNSHNQNVTRKINKESYLTIDLTTETLNTSNSSQSHMNTVIDLENNDNNTDISESSSMSGDSQVTVIQNRKSKSKIGGKQMQRLISGIGKLSSTERGKLLEVIAKKIFDDGDSASSENVKNNQSSSFKTDEDAYIKEVILGQAPSRNSIGSNIYNPQRDLSNKTGLRMIVIDGSNVAMQHSMGRVFSVKGLKICIEYFVHRGHVVKAFVPHFRCQYGKSTDGRLLDSLERQGLVIYTPSRKVQDKLISSYDDRYIVQCAAEFDGVIVSKDNYRDLLVENPRWRPVIENRLLQFTWVGDLIMFPKDPLGRNGPTLEEFLRHPTVIQHPSIL